MTHKGYGFVCYQDPAVTDIAIAGLNGLKMGERVLTVRRAGDKDGTGMSVEALSSAAAMGAAAIAAAAAGGIGIAHASHVAPIPGATRFVVLSEAVTVEEISVEEEYNDILEDMKDECGKHGEVEHIIIPRPTPENPNPVSDDIRGLRVTPCLRLLIPCQSLYRPDSDLLLSLSLIFCSFSL